MELGSARKRDAINAVQKKFHIQSLQKGQKNKLTTRWNLTTCILNPRLLLAVLGIEPRLKRTRMKFLTVIGNATTSRATITPHHLRMGETMFNRFVLQNFLFN